MEAGSGSTAATHRSAPEPLGAARSHATLEGASSLCTHHSEEDGGLCPTDSTDWEGTIAAMARSVEDVPEPPEESSLHSCASTASMKVKNVKKLSFTKGRFPRLAECAHFHYENVDFGSVQLSLAEDQNDVTQNGLESKELVYLVQICCQGRKWIVKRSYEDFRVLDKHLHLCIYDRRFSQLAELLRSDSLRDKAETISQMLTAYLSRLSAIADNKINCGPALTWMEIDNKGNHLLVHDESSLNVPAIAAAHVIKRYIAQAADELSFEVGDIVSVIDMPPKEDTGWWRGKHGFQVGFFPCECVELISEKIPPCVTNSLPKPVAKKHGKLITFLRSFMKSRPSKQKLKQRGILRERVFSCDLGEHLLNSGHDVPQVIKSCTEFIEKHGVVDGIYRLSGIASNIQKLRHEFDSEQIPDMSKDTYRQDIHSVGSLCKLYFRELPNPLLTYQLYEKFSEAVSAATDEERLVKVHDVIQQLPPPHYRTLEFLMRHLSNLAAFSYVTNMHCKNLAIVWAPNLLRSKQIESACFSGTSAFMEVRIQSVVVEFILNHVDVLFSPKLSSLIREGTGHGTLARPKTLLVCSPSTKLLSLEEAQARTQAQLLSPVSPDNKYIEVGEGPAALQGKFHTVIEFPMERKKAPTKSKKSPVGSWRSFFMGKSSTTAKRKLLRHPSEPNEMKAMALPGGRGDTGTMRSAKSEESLSSSHTLEGDTKMSRPRRPRSTSDALSTSFNNNLLDSRVKRDFLSGLPKNSSKDTVAQTSCVPALISPPRSSQEVDLRQFQTGIGSLDFDPMSFKCNVHPTEPSTSEPKKKSSGKKSGGSQSESKPSDKDANPSLPGSANPPHSQIEGGSEQRAALVSEKAASAVSPNPEPNSSKVGPSITAEEAASRPRPGFEEGQHGPRHMRTTSCGADLRGFDSKDHAEPSQSAPRELQKEPGAVTFDCTPGLVRSVSLITAQPPLRSAARMLALALAESAQQASLSTRQGAPEPWGPASPGQRQPSFCPQPHQPSPASFQHQMVATDPVEPYLSGRMFSSPSKIISTDSPSESGSPRSTCACHGSESGLSVSDACEVSAASHCPGMPAHVPSTSGGSETDLDPEGRLASKKPVFAAGVGTGSQDRADADPCINARPVSTRAERASARHAPDAQSAITALLNKEAANASNYRNILAEASMPASVLEALPHAPMTPLGALYQYISKEKDLRRTSGLSYTKELRSPLEQSTQYHYQPDFTPHPSALPKNHYSTLGPRSLHQSMRNKDHGGDAYPSSGLYRARRYPPMNGSLVYPTIRRVRSMHAPPEDGLFFFQHQPCQKYPVQNQVSSDIHQVRPYFENGKVQYRYSPYSEAPYKHMDPYRVNSYGYGHCYTLRKPAAHHDNMEAGVRDYQNSRHIHPLNQEPVFINRDVGPFPRMKGAIPYEEWASGLSDRHFSHTVRRENVVKKGPHVSSMSQRYRGSSDRKHQEVMHTRSKSDSGKDLLISTEGSDGKFRVTMVSHHSPEHPISEPDLPVRPRAERPVARTALQLKQSRSMYSYSDNVQEPRPAPRNLTLHKEYSCPDFKVREPADDSRPHCHDRPLFKTLSNHPKEDYRVAHGNARNRGRSHSVKIRQPSGHANVALEREQRATFSAQARGRAHGAAAHPDYLDGYIPTPQPKVSKPTRGGPGFLPSHGCMPLQSHRLYSTAVGQGCFFQAGLRPETEVFAE